MPERSNRFDPESAGRTVRRWLIGFALLVAFIIISLTTITRIDPAHVGIRVKLAGSNRGVQDMPVVTGWVFYNPLTEQIIEFPTSIQNVVWAQSIHEGAPHDESITFSSSEGVNVNADIGLSFSIEPSKVPHLYLRFRKTDLMELANGYVRNSMREAFSDVASRMPVQEIYGAGKHKLVVDVTHKLNDVTRPRRLRDSAIDYQWRAPIARECGPSHQSRDGSHSKRDTGREPRASSAGRS